MACDLSKFYQHFTIIDEKKERQTYVFDTQAVGGLEPGTPHNPLPPFYQ